MEIVQIGGALSGQFASLEEGDLVTNLGGWDVFIIYIGSDGNDISLYTVPEPSSLLLLLGAGLCLRRRRSASRGARILPQTLNHR